VGAWDYSNTDWTEGSCAIDIPGQSPIDIVTASATPEGVALDMQGFPDSASSTNIVSQLVVNEHTWELAWDIRHNATDPYAVLWGGRAYRLAQYHYHSPSEHAVDGQHFDMEAHHVHFCTGVNCATDDPEDEILVVSVFMTVGEENSYLSSFWGDYQDSATQGAELTNLGNPYTSFLPDNKDYYSYLGSTTTPPCAANVQWVLMKNAVTLSQAQLTAYRTAISALPQTFAKPTVETGVTAGWDVNLKTNNRPLQSVGTRIVNVYAAPVEDNTWLYAALVAAAIAAVVTAIAVCVYCQPKKKASRSVVKPKKRAVKEPVKAAAAPVEETVPLMAPHLVQPHMVQLAAPNLSMIVPQPMQYTTRPGVPMQPMHLQP